MWSKERVQLCLFIFLFFACGYSTFPAPFVGKTVLSSLNGIDTLVKDLLTMYARIYFWVLFCIPLAYVSVFLPNHTIWISIAL